MHGHKSDETNDPVLKSPVIEIIFFLYSDYKKWHFRLQCLSTFNLTNVFRNCKQTKSIGPLQLVWNFFFIHIKKFDHDIICTSPQKVKIHHFYIRKSIQEIYLSPSVFA